MSRLRILLALALVAAAAAVPLVRRFGAMDPVATRAKCVRLRDAEQWEELQQLAGDWAASDSATGDAYLMLADALMHLQKPHEAIAALRRVPPNDPKAFSALIVANDLQFGELNMPLEAEKTLRQMIGLRPDSISSRRRLIYFYAITLQLEKMLSAIRDAVEHAAEPPDAYAYLLMADHLSFTNGFEENSKWMQAAPEEPLFAEARIVQLIDRTRTSEVASRDELLAQYREILSTMLEESPTSPPLIIGMLQYAVADFDLDLAADLIGRIPEEQRNSELLRISAWHAFHDGRPEESLRLAELALRGNPLDWQSHNQRSVALRRLGDAEAAAAASRVAIVGKELRKEILQLTDAGAVTMDTLGRIAAYCEEIGPAADWVRKGILRRLTRGEIPERSAPAMQ